MMAWSIKKAENGELEFLLDGEVVEFGRILDVSVPIEDEYEDEYVRVSSTRFKIGI